MKISPQKYTCRKTYFVDQQVLAFFSKRPGLPTGIDVKKAAEDKFWQAEKMCFRTNERLSPLLHDLDHYGARIGHLVRMWKKEIRSVLGGRPRHHSRWNCRFGPGSTYLNRSDKILLLDKLSHGYSRTPAAGYFLPDWDQSAWSRYAAIRRDMSPFAGVEPEAGFAVQDFEVVRGNRFTTVHKDSTTDRGICVEASLNIYYQLGLGNEIERCLGRYYGWSKANAARLHRWLARWGSLTGDLATLDLKSASDTVCKVLVRLLFPKAWHTMLSQLRSTHTVINGKSVLLEKFSSMGNGFTFELETLLFLSLAKCLCKQAWCFGDDLIVDTDSARDLASALAFFGFTTNDRKTFIAGPFRESCGGDYYLGDDVRPFYPKEECYDTPAKTIVLANGFRRTLNCLDRLGYAPDLRHLWFRILDGLPKAIRDCRGPEELGDVVIHDRPDSWRRNTRWRSGIRYLRVWRPVGNRLLDFSNWHPSVVFAYALTGAPSGAPGTLSDALTDALIFGRSGVLPRVNGVYTSGHRFGRVAYS